MSFKIKIILYVCGVLTTMGVIIVLIIVPTILDIKKINDSIYTEMVDLEKKYLRGQLLKKTVQDFATIQPRQSKLDTIFITEGEELNFISRLEEIADQNGVKQNIELQTKNIEEKNGVKTFPLNINVDGSFVQIMNYVSTLETMNYYLNISSLEITTNRENSTANIVGNVFSKKNEIKTAKN